MWNDEPQAWVRTWCRDNQETLKRDAGRWLLLHPDLNYVGSTTTLQAALALQSIIKGKIAKNIAVINVDIELKRLEEPTPAAIKPLAPVDLDDEHPWKDTLAGYARRRGLKTTEVLMFLLGSGDPRHGLTVSSKLTDDEIKRLDEMYSPGLIVTNTDTPVSGSAHPSPHKQPPFQPRRGYDRGVVLDGGGAAWRNRTRID